MLERVPIRLRLTAGFAFVMALLLASTGIFLYFGLQTGLDRTIDGGLRSRAQDVASLVQQSDSGLREGSSTGILEQGESFAQVLTLSGQIVDTSPQLGRSRLLGPAQLSRARTGPLFVEIGPVGATEHPSRILALPVDAQDTRRIVVVGTSLEARNDALARLRTQLLIGGPVALLLASLAGYGLAAAALRPVASLRQQAAHVSGGQVGERLPIPPANDEIRELGVTLNEMLERIEATVRRERRFIADASHELRTPLSLLRAELELAQWPERRREDLDTAIRAASEETERLSQLAEDLLVIARADDGRLPIHSEPLSAQALFADTASRFDIRTRAVDRTIVVEAEDAPVYGDRLRLEQALGNLIDNAIRYGAGPIRLSASTDGDETALHVLDEGVGFDADFIPRAFQRFARADEARSRGGTGLGLAIVEVIATAHGGAAGVRNRVPHGADVWIVIRSNPGAERRSTSPGTTQC